MAENYEDKKIVRFILLFFYYSNKIYLSFGIFLRNKKINKKMTKNKEKPSIVWYNLVDSKN